jgi:DivIVA domain-containing protein
VTKEEMILNVEFPKGVRGYSCAAVDGFVAQMGTRLEAMQAKLEEQTSRADSLAAELEKARQELAAFKEKETAIANAMVAMEQRRVQVEQQNKAAKTEARQEAERIVAEGRETAESVIQEARSSAEEIIAGAEAACTEQQERIRALNAEFVETVERIRRTMEAQLSLLPPANGCLSVTKIAITATGAEIGQTAKAA